MKYLKTFEKYAYLTKEDSDKVEVIMRKFIDELNILDKIINLNFKDYVNKGFDYFEIFDGFLSSPSGNRIADYMYTYDEKEKNIYYVVDSYLRDNPNTLENKSTPALRNSMSQIIIKLYKEYSKQYKLKQAFDKTLIKLLEKNPEKYKKIYDEYSLYMPYIVIKKCQWMLNYKKYNI